MTAPSNPRQAGVDRRYRQRGRDGLRLTMRISNAANIAIDRLAIRHKCSRRDVVEGLLLGVIDKPISDEVATAMASHGFSESEARAWLGVA